MIYSSFIQGIAWAKIGGAPDRLNAPEVPNRVTANVSAVGNGLAWRTDGGRQRTRCASAVPIFPTPRTLRENVKP